MAFFILGPILLFGNFGISIRGGFWNCPFSIPFIMYNHCPTFCTFGQIRTWLFYGIVTSNFFMGKIYCGLICPAGVCQDFLFKIPTKKFSLPKKVDLKLRWLKYGFSILIVLLILRLTNLFIRIPFIENLLYFLINHTDEVRITFISTAALFLLISIFFERIWCNCFCPFGTWISIFNKFSLLKLNHNSKKCSGCNLCNQHCPSGLNINNNKNSWYSLECIRCLNCHIVCKSRVFKFGFKLEKGK